MTTTTASNSALQSYLDKQAQNIAASKASASSSSSSSATQGVFKNETTFLNILTTQLKQQDPTNTTDTNQFTQELVQFAGVEQQLNTNKDLEKLISLQKNNSGVTSALNYIGGYVEVPTTTGQMVLQSGSSEIGYTLPSTSQNTTIKISDSSGNVVKTISGPTTSGLNYVSWDGKDSNGNQLADGTYSFTVSALDSAGKAETISDTRFIGKVTGVTSNSDGTTNLSIGAVSVGTSSIDAAYSASSLPAATAA